MSNFIKDIHVHMKREKKKEQNSEKKKKEGKKLSRGGTIGDADPMYSSAG